mgnify:CR=1 FL=1
MSGSIDERIVSMRFDNRQFETGVATTMTSRNNLKRGLDLSGSAKGLETISDTANRINFNGLSSGIEAVKVKFSALQVVAVTALTNIANSAIDVGKNLVSSLTIDPIKDGFNEYETQMNSIQTILANTSSKGTSLDEVKAALQELNTYSDKTIYNFTEMTRNIGTFTAAGVDLKTSTAAIKGIANLAAVSGSNSTQASTAMYQLSQALASGKVSLEDWNSVVNAGMGGAVFQNALKETAKVMGKNVDESKSFRESISSKDGTGWLTSDVLLKTLEKFTGDMTESELAAQGYTEAQIADIMKMGQTANDAATKVKTFTQLMDTLKEAVGSGWAQTWQILFGDFDEAKVMFTDVSNTLGGMISASANARNEMLSGWKDLGGRTALIDAIKNAFDGVMGVVNAIGGAFRDIFPATTSAQLFALTEGLRNFTENLKLSDTTLANLRSTFKGLFAILDIGKTALMAIINAIGIMLGGVGNLSSTILGATGSLGEWLTALDNSIKQSDVFNKVLTTIAYGIKNSLTTISYVLNAVIKGIQTVTSYLSEKIVLPGFEDVQTFLGLLGERFASLGDESNAMASTVGSAFASIRDSITASKIGAVFGSVYDTMKTVANGIGTLIGKIADSIGNTLKNANFSGIFDAIAGVSIGAIGLSIAKFIRSMSEPLEGLSGIMEGVTGTLDAVKGSLESYQQNLKAGTLIKIAMAVGILAASILTISLIDSGKLISSLTAIGTLFAQLLVAMKLYSLIGDMKSSAIKSGIVMISMSTSILILANAMKKLSELDWEGIMKGIIGVSSLSKIIVRTAKSLSEGSGAMIKGSAGMVVYAAAIKILASACSDLAKLDWGGLAKGLVGVGVLMTEISLFLNNTKFSTKSIITATGVVILAGAMKILASACADFGGQDWGALVKGFESIGILLAEITVFSTLTTNAKNMISTGVALVAIGASMKILASALKDFGSMDWGNIVKGLKAMGIVLAELALAVNMLPSNLPVTATGLVIVGAALKIVASALNDMGGMSWDEIVKGLTALGGSLTILSVALNAMTGTLAGSAALLVAAGALAILAPALSLLGAMTWESIIKGLVDLAATIAIFGVSAAVLTPILPSMLGLSAALALLGISMLGIGAGLALVGVGLAGVATGFTLLAGTTAAGATAIVASLGIIITGVAALIPAIMEKIGEGIVAFIQVFTDSIPQIVECITTIITAIVDCIVTNIPTIVNGVLQTLSSILDAIVQWIPTIGQQVADIISGLLTIIANNIEKFVEQGLAIVVGFINGIADGLPQVIDAAFNLIITFINGLADGIRNNASAIGDACVNLVDAIVEGVGELEDKFIEAGEHAVEGFIIGLGRLPGKLLDAGADLGKKALQAAKESLDIHSPSRKFKELGVYSAQGYVVGLESYNDKIINASSDIGNKAIYSMGNAISGISDAINSNMDSQPTIRPVLDLSSIQNGSKQLYNMIGNLDAYNINGSMQVANSTAKSIQRNQLVNSSIKSNDTSTSFSAINNPINTKQPITLQLVLQNGRAIAEYIVDDVDNLMGGKNKIIGRSVGL